MNRTHICAGLSQALGVIAYAFLVALVVNSLDRMDQIPELVAVTFMLSLLTFSVATVATLVFAYPTKLAFEKKFGDAIRVVVATVLFGFAIIGVILTLAIFFFS